MTSIIGFKSHLLYTDTCNKQLQIEQQVRILPTNHLAYTLSPELLYEKFGTSLDGLTENQVSDRVRKYGPNELPEARKASIFRLIINQFRSWLVVLLIAAVVISLLAGELVDAWVITAVILINAFIGIIRIRMLDPCESKSCYAFTTWYLTTELASELRLGAV